MRLRRHAGFSEAVRGYFRDRGYIEVDTPTLSPFLIPEPAIEVFRTEYVSERGRGPDLWLAPSPELWMKRLLARGAGDIFQVSRCFRNGDLGSPIHNPEFRLLEWYTTGGGYLESIEVAEGLFSRLLAAGASEGWAGDHDGAPARRLSPPFGRMTMEEAFRRFSGIELSLCQDASSMAAAGRAAGVRMPRECTWEEAFHIVFLTLVEPSLPREKPLILMDYPALVPTTARGKPGTPWAERWELFVDGVEIANCYTEETEPRALSRLIQDEEERKKRSLVPHAIDRGFPAVFPPGFPR